MRLPTTVQDALVAVFAVMLWLAIEGAVAALAVVGWIRPTRREVPRSAPGSTLNP